MGTESQGVSVPGRESTAVQTKGTVTLYDSGWLSDSNATSHTVAIPNALGKIPAGMELSFSPDGGSTVYSVAYRWWGGGKTMNPVTVQVTPSQILLGIYNGAALFSVWNAATGAWTQYSGGYWKAVYWTVS
jgi:hypothetical protein